MTDTANGENVAIDQDELRKRVEGLEAAQATQAATLAGAQATQAAMNAGTMATLTAGGLSLIAGVFIGLAFSRR
jgi:hypothetical protein